ncbi:AAA family ATPase [Pedobacter deserti]|uniref:AAA family ATPase n=1 Tax=Pedobacter deserti TaxID=2817382 RepID=UPI00210AB934|nr:AAA family ATPase [Pedobacter sp. SYSU D00382]
MEIIYLYIGDDGKNIKDCEFNFSPEFRISYDQNKNYINVNKNEAHLPNFWEANNIYNITAIIGKNGAGKSNLLEFIFRYYTSSSGLSNLPRMKLIHIYRRNGYLYINRNDIASNYNFRNKHYVQYPLNNFRKDVSTKFLHYSTHYEKNILFDLGGGITSEDISTGGLLRKYGEDRKVMKFPEATSSDIERLMIDDTFRQIELITSSNATYFKGISLPKALNITFKKGANKLKIDNPVYDKLFIDKPLPEMDFIEHFTNRFLYAYFNDPKNASDLEIVPEDLTVEEFIKKSYAGELYSELISLNETGKILFTKYPDNMGMRSDYSWTFGVKTVDLSFNLRIGLYRYYFKGDVFSNPSSLDHRGLAASDLTIGWHGLSAGELEYLNLLSRIYASINEVIIDHGQEKNVQRPPQTYKNIILLLDEPENSFHPEWQRLFLSNLLDFLNKTTPYHTFQIILASHSPIIISDFPKDNIIFLDKNEINGTCRVVNSISRDNTFGANIHTLYRNSFFIDGLPIGEFAKKKINQLFDELENAEAIRPTILKEIQMIGEPIIRDELMKLYKQREGVPEEVNRRIAELEKEIRILKDRLND